MDFFLQQRRARRRTGWILLAFLLAVAGIVLSINVVGGYIYLVATSRTLWPVAQALAAVPRSAYVVTTLVVLGVVAGGTIRRMVALSSMKYTTGAVIASPRPGDGLPRQFRATLAT